MEPEICKANFSVHAQEYTIFTKEIGLYPSVKWTDGIFLTYERLREHLLEDIFIGDSENSLTDF